MTVSTGPAQVTRVVPIHLVDNFETSVIRWIPISVDFSDGPKFNLFDAAVAIDKEVPEGGVGVGQPGAQLDRLAVERLRGGRVPLVEQHAPEHVMRRPVGGAQFDRPPQCVLRAGQVAAAVQHAADAHVAGGVPGVEFHRPLEDTEDGLRAFEILDGDGYVLCFGRKR